MVEILGNDERNFLKVDGSLLYGRAAVGIRSDVADSRSVGSWIGRKEVVECAIFLDDDYDMVNRAR
jgi:hypothetical protein